MQLDLSGKARTHDQACVRLYADEIKSYQNSLGEKWMYIGLLAIPESRYQEVLRYLEEDRETASYQGELHFTKLKNYSYAHEHYEKTLLAKHWVERVLWDDQKIFHFHLLGLNLSNIELSIFGSGRGRHVNIYNRFFRATIAYTLKSFFRAPRIVVTSIFHDTEEQLDRSDFFRWHTIWRLGHSESGVIFRAKNIQFINSDHRREPLLPNDSQLLQLCDVLTGGLTQCLDARTTKDGCCEIAQTLLPLAERLTDRRRARNPNSRYRHTGRLSISFFPSRKLTPEELEDPWLRAKSGFYIERGLLFKDRSSGQLALPLE